MRSRRKVCKSCKCYINMSDLSRKEADSARQLAVPQPDFIGCLEDLEKEDITNL